MSFARFSLLVSFLAIAAACSSSSSGGSGGATTTATTTGTGGAIGPTGEGAGGAPPCHGDQAAWTAITTATLDCTQNSDCCVVTNGCLSQAQVVAAADYAAAPAAWYYCEPCNDCIVPAIQVGCVGGKCVGQNVDSSSPPPDESLRQDHCGVDAPAVPATTLHFGCGG